MSSDSDIPEEDTEYIDKFSESDDSNSGDSLNNISSFSEKTD
jgi:hypothetical protein